MWAALRAALVLVLMTGLISCARRDTSPAREASTLYLSTLRIRGFDPVKVGDVSSAQALQRIYEGLVQVSYLDRPYRVEPLLARAMPDVSPDGLIYTFVLKEGLHFQDDPCFAGGRGREVVAEDVVYSLKRLADARNASTGWWAFDQRIKGLNEFRQASREGTTTDYARVVSGLEVMDRYTLRIHLTQPYPQLLWVLALHYGSVVPREAVAYYGERFGQHPVGTGPFRLQEWNPNYQLVFVRNPSWSEGKREERYPGQGEPGDAERHLLADAGRALPFLDRIVAYVVADSATQWMMFLGGQLDESDISRDNWSVVLDAKGELVPALRERGVRLSVSPQLRIAYIGFNADDPVVGTNAALRQAMTLAFNSEEWIRLHNGRVRRPNSPIPSTLAGYEADYQPWPFDLERARKRLAEAGYPEGRDPATGRRLELTLDLGRADDVELRQSAELVAAFMERLGVVLRINLNNGPAFYEKLERRQAQLFLLSWLGDYPDAENFLQCFYGPNASPGPNRANYVNPAFDRMLEAARVLPDSPERTELYKKMARVVMDDCPWIFISEPLSYVLHQRRVANYKPHLFPFGMEKYYRLEP
jgi:oligopeptide transport system substrate-binding protein